MAVSIKSNQLKPLNLEFIGSIGDIDCACGGGGFGGGGGGDWGGDEDNETDKFCVGDVETPLIALVASVGSGNLYLTNVAVTGCCACCCVALGTAAGAGTAVGAGTAADPYKLKINDQPFVTDCK